MAILTFDAIKEAICAAYNSWRDGEAQPVTWEHLCRVDPLKGFPQASVLHTAFATALFSEVAALVKGAGDNTVRVTYRGVKKRHQSRLQAYVSARLPGLRIEAKEHCTLDFALLESRKSENQLHSVRLATESEMKPISGAGNDPDLLVYDLAKLAMLGASYKLYIGRVNGGRESTGGSKSL